MRRSLAAITAITVPLFAVVACGAQPASSHKPVKGIVTEKEYEPAKTKKTCKKNRKTGRRTCTTKTVKKECYEVEIVLDKTGKKLELCDRAVFNALGEGDPYNSAIDYAKVGNLT